MAGATANKWIGIGRLVRDPELRTIPDGTAVANFCIAVDRGYAKDKEASNKQTVDFIDITVWRKLAEICNEYLKKGSLVFIEGRLQIRSYEDKEGNKRKATDIVANNVQFLTSKNDNEVSNSTSQGSDNTNNNIPDDEDVPF